MLHPPFFKEKKTEITELNKQTATGAMCLFLQTENSML